MILKAGIDEAGRGPLAGPVTAGCVVLPDDFPLDLLNDSKKMTEKRRVEAEKVIKDKSCWGIGVVSHDVIDEINILQATLLAMKTAYEMMMTRLPDWCERNGISVCDAKIQTVVDGIYVPEIDCDARAEVKADGKFPEVMAASIIAKVGRDNIMIEYDKLYPEYGYAKHKGYPTPAHKELCRKIGPSPIQRLSFNIEPKSKKNNGKR